MQPSRYPNAHAKRSRPRPALLSGWGLLAAIATVPLFHWQYEYFRQRGPVFAASLIVLFLMLAAAAYFHNRRAARTPAGWLSLSVLLPAAAAFFYDTRAAVVVALMVGSGYVLGRGLLALMGCELEGAVEELAISTGLGLGAAMMILFALGMAGLYYRPVFAALLAAPLVAFPRQVVGLGSSMAALARGWMRPEEGDGAERSLAVVFGVALGACGMTAALAPSVAFDAIRLHLPAAAYYQAIHAVRPLPFNDYSYFPQGMETLMAMAGSLGGQTAEQLIAFAFFALSVMMCHALARRAGFPAGAAALGAVAAASMPFAHWTGSMAKNDLAVAFFELAALYALIRAAGEPEGRWLPLAALLMGLAFEVKYTAVYGALPLGLMMAYQAWRSPGRWKKLAAVGALAAAAALPWPARAWVLTGNPAYPQRVGRAAEMQVAQPGLGMGAKLLHTAQTPWTMEFGRQPHFNSVLRTPMGVVLALFFPALVLAGGWNGAGRRCLFFAGGYFVYWAAVWPVLRFGAAWAMVAVTLAVAAAMRICAKPGWARRAELAAAFYGLAFSLSGAMIIELNAPQAVLFTGRIGRAEYLRRALEPYHSMEALGRLAGPRDMVLGVGSCAALYAPYPWRYVCREAEAPQAEIRAELERGGYRWLVAPQAWMSGGRAKPAWTGDGYAIYRLDAGP